MLAPRHGRAIGLSSVPVLLMACVACAPSYQPEPSQPASSTQHREPAPTEPAPTTTPLARTPVPSDGPLRGQPQTTTPRAQPQDQPQTQPQTQPQVRGLEPRYQAILDRHNQLRAKHCAPPLRWSQALQDLAQDWANQLQDAGCAFEHRPNNRAGENLTFFAPRNSQLPEDVADGWYSEVSLYDFAKGGFDFRTGHFTQVVWRGTQHLGCGVSTCNGGEIWVCNYDPPGNMMGSFPKNVQPSSCSK